MIRLSKLADYAIVILASFGKGEGLATASALAGETGLSEPTVAKLLKGLAAGGLVLSVRGARGGYRLATGLESISVARVIGVIDGPICLVDCCEGRDCGHEASCGLSGHWDVVNQAVRHVLETITLADMVASPARGDPAKICSVKDSLKIRSGVDRENGLEKNEFVGNKR